MKSFADFKKNLGSRFGDAALEHAANVGESETAVGDLEQLLNVVFEVVNEETARCILLHEDLRDLFDHEEYASIKRELEGW